MSMTDAGWPSAHDRFTRRPCANSTMEMTRIAQDGSILHGLECGRIDDVAVSGNRDPDVRITGGLSSRHHAIALHMGLKCLQRIHLAYDDIHAHALGSQGQAAAAIAVAGHDHGTTAKQAVRGAYDAVERRLAGAVVVVEEMLRVGIIDIEHGVTQRAVGGHGGQADDTRGGFLGASDDAGELVGMTRVQRGVQIGAVVHDDLGIACNDGLDVAVVRIHVLAGDGVDFDAVVLHQSGGGVVLRGQRVAGA